jgi:hypothetical protein
MKRDARLPEPELDRLLERGRIIRPLPDVVRARALARARATVAAAAAETALPAPAATVPVRAGARRIAVAASIALLVGAAGAMAALRARSSDRLEAAPASPPPAIPRSRVVAPEIPLPAPAAPEPPSAGKVHRPARAAGAQDSYRAELDLLQRAQVAFAGRDFADALILVAEHARRFPNGRLAEEREAVRIRSLVGSGRGDDARRAVATFANRFPRSVLLARLHQTANDQGASSALISAGHGR